MINESQFLANQLKTTLDKIARLNKHNPEVQQKTAATLIKVTQLTTALEVPAMMTRQAE